MLSVLPRLFRASFASLLIATAIVAYSKPVSAEFYGCCQGGSGCFYFHGGHLCFSEEDCHWYDFGGCCWDHSLCFGCWPCPQD